jgi:predicted nuclease of restriction endonuclease-like (RecB) superfamily
MVKKTKEIGRRAVEMPVRRSAAALPLGYAELLAEFKNRIQNARVRAAVAASRELVRLYWDIGREIVRRQEQEGWGKGVVDRLGGDIQRAFPGIAGFSSRNIWRMRAFYRAYTPEAVVLPQLAAELEGADLPQAAAEIPWFHNVVLIEKLKNSAQRLWYAQKVVQHGWSRAVLLHQIELDLYGREGRAITNFSETLPKLQSDLARQVLKDPYVFDFLTLADEARERELERGLLERLRDFMVSKYRLTAALPHKLKSSLPTIKQLQEELKNTSRKDRPSDPRTSNSNSDD